MESVEQPNPRLTSLNIQEWKSLTNRTHHLTFLPRLGIDAPPLESESFKIRSTGRRPVTFLIFILIFILIIIISRRLGSKEDQEIENISM